MTEGIIITTKRERVSLNCCDLPLEAIFGLTDLHEDRQKGSRPFRTIAAIWRGVRFASNISYGSISWRNRGN